MSVVPLQIARVSMQLRSSLLLGSMQSRELDLLKVQGQISSNQRLNRASDDPAAAVGILRLKRQMATSTQYQSNLEFAKGFLSSVDASMSGLSDMITQAKTVASSQIGAASTAQERAAQATVIDSLLQRAYTIANTRHRGISVYGGQNGTQDAFSGIGGGYKYNGSTIGQGILAPDGSSLEYTMNGNDVFGGLSSQVEGYRDLTPALTSATRLADVRGARLQGIAAGTVAITDGATTLSVDLSRAATVGDVVTTINNALSTAGLASSVSLSGGHLVLNASGTTTLTIADVATGTTAADLGIAGTAPAAGTLAGTDIGPRVTALTPLAALAGGTGIDPAGITISNGAASATISLSGPPALTTVQDLLNAINGSGTNVRAEIKADGTGLNLFNPISGAPLRVGENGGTTASGLGLRSFQPATALRDLNLGGGITPIGSTLGGPTGDIVVTRTDGSTFSVRLDGLKTSTQIAAAITAASGGNVAASVSSTTNAISLVDTAGGGGNVAVSAAGNYVSNSSMLGIFATGTGATLSGTPMTLSTDDFRITRRDGTSFTVNMLGAATVQDVLDRINTAGGNTGANAVTASLAGTGNGLVLTDASAGAGTLSVAALNASPVAAQLGILKPATTASRIDGDDVNPLEPQGLFSSLSLLRDGLRANDSSRIQRAAELLEKDAARVIQARGTVGARVKDIESRLDDADNEQLQVKSALSSLADTDMTAAITRYTQLQTAYEASLKVAQSTQNLSLLDFLR